MRRLPSAPGARVAAVGFVGVLAFLASSCSDADLSTPPNLPTWEDDPCATVPSLGQYEALMARWRAQTDAAPYEPGRVAFTGSSSIRFWEPLQEDLADWAPIQRGFGGSILWEVAEYVDETVIRHDPSAVVIFAGTNDIFVDIAPEAVADAYRCVVQKIAQGLGDDVSIHYIAITPTPSRWAIWPNADEANRRIAEIASEYTGLHFIDTTPAFLATGEPPDAGLFISDGLHLSDAGYAMWKDAVLPHLDATVPRFRPRFGALASGTRVLVDLGPSEEGHGAPTTSPDAFGQHWNSWHPIPGETLMNAGEHIDLIDVTGAPTGLRLVFASANHFARGVSHGGLLEPDPDLLGSLAVPTATQDYIYTTETGTVVGSRGSLTLEGLDPTRSYMLRIFASRADSTAASTRFSVSGAAEPAVAVVDTSGAGNGNDSQIVAFSGLSPDSSGRLHLDFEPATRELGGSAYLNLFELEVE